jgi:hypothetical protein
MSHTLLPLLAAVLPIWPVDIADRSGGGAAFQAPCFAPWFFLLLQPAVRQWVAWSFLTGWPAPAAPGPARFFPQIKFQKIRGGFLIDCCADGPGTPPAIFGTMFSRAPPVPFLRIKAGPPRRSLAELRKRTAPGMRPCRRANEGWPGRRDYSQARRAALPAGGRSRQSLLDPKPFIV